MDIFVRQNDVKEFKASIKQKQQEKEQMTEQLNQQQVQLKQQQEQLKQQQEQLKRLYSQADLSLAVALALLLIVFVLTLLAACWLRTRRKGHAHIRGVEEDDDIGMPVPSAFINDVDKAVTEAIERSMKTSDSVNELAKVKAAAAHVSPTAAVNKRKQTCNPEVAQINAPAANRSKNRGALGANTHLWKS
jgi:chromosome segregation ATPase